MVRIQLSEVDADRVTRAHVGDTVEITLPELPTTGYRWSWVMPAGVRTVADKYVPGPPGRPGQGGQRQLVIELEKPGPKGLRAELARTWEPDAHRVLNFDLDVATETRAGG